MNKRDIEVLEEFIKEWNSPQAMAYASDPDFEEGIDRGREECADALEYWLSELKKDK